MQWRLTVVGWRCSESGDGCSDELAGRRASSASADAREEGSGRGCDAGADGDFPEREGGVAGVHAGAEPRADFELRDGGGSFAGSVSSCESASTQVRTCLDPGRSVSEWMVAEGWRSGMGTRDARGRGGGARTERLGVWSGG